MISVYTTINDKLSLFKIDTDDHHLAIIMTNAEEGVTQLALAFIEGGKYIKNSILQVGQK
jgi:hypothetical protein